MIARMTQSKHMATTIPITPNRNVIANIAENNSLATVVAMDITVMYFTSPAALNPFPNGSARGYATELKIL